MGVPEYTEKSKLFYKVPQDDRSFYQKYPIFISLSLYGFQYGSVVKTDSGYEIQLSQSRIVALVFRAVVIFIQIGLLISTLYNLFEDFTTKKKRGGLGYHALALMNIITAMINYTVLCHRETVVIDLYDRIETHFTAYFSSAKAYEIYTRVRWLTHLVFGVFMVFAIGIIINGYNKTVPSENLKEIGMIITNETSINSTSVNATVDGQAIVDEQATANVTPTATPLPPYLDTFLFDTLEETTLYYIFCEIFNLVFAVTGCHTCMLLTAAFQINQYGNKAWKNENIVARTILSFRACHMRAQEMALVCDPLLCKAIFIYVGNLLISIAFIAHTLKVSTLEPYQYSLIAFLVLHFFYFVVLVFASSDVNEEISGSDHNSIPSCDEIIKENNYDEQLRAALRMSLLHLTKLNITTYGISVLGMFSVEKGIILTVIGAALTYSSILYDIS